MASKLLDCLGQLLERIQTLRETTEDNASTYLVWMATPATYTSWSMIWHHIYRSHWAGASTLQSIIVTKSMVG